MPQANFTYSRELGEKVCERLASGLSLTEIGKDINMPKRGTVFAWTRKFPEFAEMYDRAQRQKCEALAEEILDIADEASNDYMQRKSARGELVMAYNKEAVMRSHLRIETRKWLLARLLSHKYGNHIDVTSGGQPLPAVQIVMAALPANEATVIDADQQELRGIIEEDERATNQFEADA